MLLHRCCQFALRIVACLRGCVHVCWGSTCLHSALRPNTLRPQLYFLRIVCLPLRTVTLLVVALPNSLCCGYLRTVFFDCSTGRFTVLQCIAVAVVIPRDTAVYAFLPLAPAVIDARWTNRPDILTPLFLRLCYNRCCCCGTVRSVRCAVHHTTH